MRAGTVVSGLGIATTLATLAVLCVAVVYYPCFRATQARLSRDKVRALHDDGPDKLFNTADDLTYPVSAARSGLR